MSRLKDPPKELPEWQRKLEAEAQAAQDNQSVSEMDIFAWRLFHQPRRPPEPVVDRWETSFGNPGFGE